MTIIGNMKKRIIYLALEPLEQRYNVMFNEAIRPHADIVIEPFMQDYEVIRNGEFLDVTKTIEFKSKQIRIVADMFTEGQIKEGDVFLVGDIFFPGIESLRYMSELLGIKIFIYGFNFAGRSDPHDFVQKLGAWSDASELGYHAICDGIFVGSSFHGRQVYKYFNPITSSRIPIYVTGYIWDKGYPLSLAPVNENKVDRVIWPHRIAQEKGWLEFLEYANITKRNILITSCGNAKIVKGQLPDNVDYRANLTKKEYYELLSTSKYYLSTAHQETFGYTVQEAILYGCRVAVPIRACYGEMVRGVNLYNGIQFIDDVLNDENSVVPIEYTDKWHDNIKAIIKIINGEDLPSGT